MKNISKTLLTCHIPHSLWATKPTELTICLHSVTLFLCTTFFFAELANINEISLEKRENISETAKFILNDETKEAFQLPSKIR